MKRTDIINTLIKVNNYKTYLEIGLADPDTNYNLIDCECKECVDPYILEDHKYFDLTDVNRIQNIIDTVLTYRITSDEFFSQNKKTYDLIFIDGLHTKEQVSRDIINALKVLNPGGKIVVHDCLPPNESCQIVPRIQDYWTGDVWKAIPELKKQNIVFNVVDTDFGCGIIEYYENSNELEYITDFDNTWTDFENNRNNLLNVISTYDFFIKYVVNKL
jgi:hypothetical protein